MAPLLLMNCKEDDEGEVYEGVWIGSNVKVENCNTAEDEYNNDLTCDDNSCYRLSLNGDGTFSFQEVLDTKIGTWSVSGSSLSLCIDEEGEQECTTYSTTIGARLTLSLTSESTGCTTTTTFGRE